MQRNVEQRYSIKFCVKLGLTPSETIRMLRLAYGDETMNRTSVFEWHKKFKDGRANVQDDARAGRPVSVTIEENVTKVGNLLRSNRKSKPPIRTIAQELNLSKSSTHSMIKNRLKKQTREALLQALEIQGVKMNSCSFLMEI
uniref:Mos1 transposase HTH domain-containing protein n=1 Tax=Anopheles atroparvus TaxID=41427 RepID=A0AAG5CPD5_ANOAO